MLPSRSAAMHCIILRSARRLITGLLFMALLAGHAAAGNRAVTRLEFSGALPAHDKLSLVLDEWCRELNRRSGGRIHATFYPGGILTPAAQMFDSVMTGIADIGFAPTGITPGRFPLTEIMEAPLGIESAAMMT
ncbi:MAG: TRAP-type C4-dicarboxylate transport system, periplasmic component, partial [Acidobacteria bacterium]|nr:TRAP-type C4-dicarboxylate transport system, periplasmic component [Acidobacteriota bacterium]